MLRRRMREAVVSAVAGSGSGVAALLACLAVLGGVAPARAQTPQQLEFLRQNPELVRQQLLRSGLTPEQMRARLQSAGISPSALDRFLQPGADTLGAPPLGNETLRALEALGVARVQAQGLEFVPVDTGLVVSLQPSRLGEGKLELFGLDVFRGRTTRFQPVLSGPVPPSYKVGPGDVLVLVLTGDVELTHQLEVTREGFILIPQVGQLFLNGLSMEQLSRALRDRLGRSYSGIRTGTTRFDVTIARLRTNQVFVIGEVVQPGAYQLASVATTLNGLYAAGGLTDRANLRGIQVRRNGDVVSTLDLYDYLLRGDTKNDVVLEQGDVVFVPVRGVRASVSGAVIRPAIYELKAGQTLADLVEAAGGFQPNASLERIAIHRMLPPAERAPGPVPRTVVDVRLGLAPRDGDRPAAGRDPFLGVAIPRVSLEDGDSVVVDAVTGLGGSLSVSILGMVRKPGSYPWRESMTLRELVTLARGPTVGADLREAEIAHLPAERNGGRLAEVVRVPLDSTYLFQRDSLGSYLGAAGIAFPAAGTAPEVVLRPYDQVTIFRQPQFELQRTIAIAGEVQFPGSYALQTKDERISELVKRAGGLLPTAYSDGARFQRVLEDNTHRVAIRLADALRRPGGPDDLVLQPGDELTIPEYSPTVSVEGAVNSPATILYLEGEGVGYYVANAGGYARNADKGRVSVRYANGSARVKGRFLIFSTSPRPGPGSVVAVPSKPEGAPFNLAGFLASLAQIVASAVAIVAIATP